MAVLNAAQEEQLRDIGTHLQKLRQQQSISIEEVADKTCIRLRMLKALEEGKLDDLPEPVYIQGFIRRYGDFLGLDGNALAKTFSTDYPPVEFDAQAILGTPTAKKPEVNIPAEPVAIQETSETTESDVPASPSEKSIPPYLAYIILGVAAVFGLVYAVNTINRPRNLETATQKSPSPSVQQQQPGSQTVSASPIVPTPSPIEATSISPSPTTSPTELATQSTPAETPTTINLSPSPSELTTQPNSTSTPTTNASPSPSGLEIQPTPAETPTAINSSPSPSELEIQPTPAETPTTINSSPNPSELTTQPTPADTSATNSLLGLPVQVNLNLQEESWVRITADGKTVFEGVLKKGTQQSFSAEKQLTIRSGNAGAVLVSVNQKEAQPLGKLGAVREVTFTPEP